MYLKSLLVSSNLPYNFYIKDYYKKLKIELLFSFVLNQGCVDIILICKAESSGLIIITNTSLFYFLSYNLAMQFKTENCCRGVIKP